MQGFSGRIVTQKNLNGVIDKPRTVVDSDYELLENKPSVEGVMLSGNKSLEDLGLIFDSKTIIRENGILTVADGSHKHTAENIEGLQEALDAAADHAADTDNPHNVTKSQLGLGNVENKSSEAIRGELTKANVTDALGYTPSSDGAVETVSSSVRRRQRPSDLFRIF